MTDTSTEATYLIRKGGAFYRPNCQGYTISVIQAGRYTLEEAERETHPNGLDGPRDGMSYLHEDDAISDDWDSYRALAAERDALRAALEKMRAVLEQIESHRRLCVQYDEENGHVPRTFDEEDLRIMEIAARAALNEIERAITDKPRRSAE
jgi:hypothetical protein